MTAVSQGMQGEIGTTQWQGERLIPNNVNLLNVRKCQGNREHFSFGKEESPFAAKGKEAMMCECKGKLYLNVLMVKLRELCQMSSLLVNLGGIPFNWKRRMILKVSLKERSEKE